MEDAVVEFAQKHGIELSVNAWEADKYLWESKMEIIN